MVAHVIQIQSATIGSNPDVLCILKYKGINKIVDVGLLMRCGVEKPTNLMGIFVNKIATMGGAHSNMPPVGRLGNGLHLFDGQICRGLMGGSVLAAGGR